MSEKETLQAILSALTGLQFSVSNLEKEQKELRKEMKEGQNSLRAEMREGQEKLDVKIDQRFSDLQTQMYRGFDDNKKSLDKETRERGKMEEKLDKVYETREKVKVGLTKGWLAASMLIAFTASLLSLGIAKAFSG